MATTVVRKFNWQWRIMLHHAIRVPREAAIVDESVSEPGKSLKERLDEREALNCKNYCY
jgi:hypothetical protein